MIISKFYELIREELWDILENSPYDQRLKQHKDPNQNLGYALLVWFIRFYGQSDLYKSYVTDGSGDHSCDIIFSKKTAIGENIFYIVQSKMINLVFNAEKKLVKQGGTPITEDNFPKIKKEEFGSTLNDFMVILTGTRPTSQNENFNERYAELRKHLADNGKAKFIFFTLAGINEEIRASIVAFHKTYSPNISLEVIDIERIKRDFIDFRYKEIKTSNPLEYAYTAEDTPVELTIARLQDVRRDIFEFEGRAKACMVLMKPKTVHQLFKQYGFSLFFKNVRNPIHRSNYNPKIVETLLKEPNSFWYFNNGVTAITKILPDIGVHAEKIEVLGFQIINGAQTVYSVYSAYEQATYAQQQTMDEYAKISVRLIGSSDERFNLQITRYTNAQNPMEERDFWANDPIQQRLQNASFLTNMWYEKRRDEFRLSEEQQKKLGIGIVKNENLVAAYFSFHIQKPSYAILRREDWFISEKDRENGLYETIFNENTKFEDMYVAISVFATLLELSPRVKEIPETLTLELESVKHAILLSSVSLSRIMMENYFNKIYPNQNKKFNLDQYLFETLKNDNDQKSEKFIELQKILVFSVQFFIYKQIINESMSPDQMLIRLKELTLNSDFYDLIAKEVRNMDLNIEEIRSIEL